jgi:hypothetical protein
VRPVPVTVSPQAGGAGTAVGITADLRGCTKPKSATGSFSSPGTRQALSAQIRGSQYTARYTVRKHDGVGSGSFTVVCDVGLPTATQGSANFQVRPLAPIPVTVTPRAGGPGTTVTLTANVPAPCDPVRVAFSDRKAVAGQRAAKRLTDAHFSAGRVTGHYTVASRDAVGKGRFMVVCYQGDDRVNDGSASFRVRAARGETGPSGGNDPTAGNTVDRNDGIQIPTQIDTGQGGTAAGGIDLIWLLLPAGLLLIAAAVVIRFRHTTARRRR